MRWLEYAYALILGALVSGFLTFPMGGNLEGRVGTWLYIGAVVAVVTFLTGRALRFPLKGRMTDPIMVATIVVASGVGILAGWWALTYTMGGPA